MNKGITKLVSFIILVLLSGCTTINSNKYYSYRVSDEGVFAISPAYNASHKTLEVIGADQKTFVDLGEGYAIDSRFVYFRGYIILDADPKTIKVIEDTYAKDKNRVYLEGREIVDALPADFATIKNKKGIIFNHYPYSRDSKSVFYEGKKVPVCDLSSFKLADKIYKNWAEDSDCIYAEGKKLQVEDKSTFEFIDRGYWHNGVEVFYKNKQLEGASVETFKIFRKFHGTDGDSCYRYGKKEPCDNFGGKRTNISQLLSRIEALKNGTAPEIANNLSKIKLKTKEAGEKRLAELLETTPPEQLLTPETVKSVNWKVSKPTENAQYKYREVNTKIDVGLYTLVWNSAVDTSVDAVFIGKVGRGKYVFSDNGAIIEEPSKESLNPRFNIKYTNNRCHLVIGVCKYVEIMPYGTENEIEVTTSYSNGIWITSNTQNDELIKSIYNLDGLQIASVISNTSFVKLIEKTSF